MKVALEFNYPEDEDNLKKFVQAVGGREWVGLTDEETDAEAEKEEQAHGFVQGALWAEAKLKEKNG